MVVSLRLITRASTATRQSPANRLLVSKVYYVLAILFGGTTPAGYELFA